MILFSFLCFNFLRISFGEILSVLSSLFTILFTRKIHKMKMIIMKAIIALSSVILSKEQTYGQRVDDFELGGI